MKNPAMAPDVALDESALRGLVFAWAYRLLQSREDAEDVTQEALLRWTRAKREEAAFDHPIAWIRRVTVNLALDARKALSRRADRERRTWVAPPPDKQMALEADERESLHAALRLLSEQQRYVVLGKAFEGHTFAELAQQLKVTVPTVKTHFLRGLIRLREALDE